MTCPTCPALKEERDELQQSAHLRWESDQRAIRKWQDAAPGRTLTWPNHADLSTWLLEENTALAAQVKRWEDKEVTRASSCADHTELLEKENLELAAQVAVLVEALKEIRNVSTYAGAWRSDCSCLKRIPHMGEVANQALSSLPAAAKKLHVPTSASS